MREYKDWELCPDNMSGVHTWSIQKRAPENLPRGIKEEFVACHRCGKQPPTLYRTPIFEKIKAELELDARQKELSRAFHEGTHAYHNRMAGWW